MKVRVERDVLADAVAWSARSLPSRPNMPVLAGLLLTTGEAGSDSLSVSGFDYEQSTQSDLFAEVIDPGRVLVSGRLLASITKALPRKPVELSREETRLIVTCGSARFGLPLLPVEDYPTLPAIPAASGTVDGAAFAEAVAQVAVAATNDPTLPVLTGVRIEVDGDTLTLAATDRYRLAVRTLPWKSNETGTGAVLVPARTLADAVKMLAGGDVALGLDEDGDLSGNSTLAFSGGERSMTTRRLDGEFPKYRTLFPGSAEATAVVDVATLTEAVKRVATVSVDRQPLRFAFDEDSVTVTAGTADDAQGTEAVDIDYQGEPMTVGLSSAYLLDALGAVGTERVQLAFTKPGRPVVFTPIDPDGVTVDEYRHLVMPVRL